MASPAHQYATPMAFDPSFESPARQQQSGYPIFDPQSPFVKQGATHPNGIPGSVDGRLRAKLTGSGTNGGFLVSPLVKLGPGGGQQYIPESPITIANPAESQWGGGLAGLGMHDAGVEFDFGAHDLASAYASPTKHPRLGLSGGSRIASCSGAMLVPDGPPPSVMPSMIPSSAKKPRSISGLGTPLSAMRGRRMRQVTHDSSTMPVSPLSHAKARGDRSTLASAPLMRAVSASAAFMGVPAYQHERTVSSSTASTWNEIMSPHLYPDGQIGYPIDSHTLDYNGYPSSAMLDTPALDHSQASPVFSPGRSPPQTPQAHHGLFYTSPTSSQGSFSQSGRYDDDTQPYTIHGQMSTMMQPSLSNSSATYVSDVPFPGTALNTISETPYLGDDEDQMPSTLGHDQSYSTGLLPSQATFSHVSYPSNPALNVSYQNYKGSLYQSSDDWTPNASSTAPFPDLPMPQRQYSNMPAYPTRHVSQSYINYSAPSGLPYPAPRSFSSSYIPVLPSGLDVGGLFPHAHPGTTSAPGSATLPPNAQMHSQAGMHVFQTMQSTQEASGSVGPVRTPTKQYSHQAQAGPSRNAFSEGEETPRKRRAQYPMVGKRLRPGPKPKPKTPKKGGKAEVEEAPAVPGSGAINPSLLGQAENLKKIEPPTSLVIVAQGEAESAANADDEGILSPTPEMETVPQGLLLEDGGMQTAGLPKALLESLYTGFLTLEGSSSGQPVKRYRCLIDGCDRHFPRKSAIHSHIQTHLEDKPFVCTAPDW